MLSHTDAADRTTTWRYSARNQRIEQTDPSPPGTTQTWDYDVADNVERHVDRRGIVHSQRHDGENRVIERRRDGLRIETLAYDGPGRVDTRTDARGEATKYTYDPAGSVLSETRALGFAQRWTYWPWGSVETHTDADGLVRTFEYDPRQRLTKDTDPAGAITTHDYDLADHRTQTTRPGAAEWTYAFDADGKLIEVESPEGHTTVYEHDAHGNRSAQRNAAGIVTHFDYDARHRVTAIDHPVGGDEGFAYNGEGELTVHTDRAGQRIEIERDGLGRITERRYGAAQSGEVNREAFTLDGDGQPTTLSQYGDADGPHHVQRRYDGQGRLIEEDDRYGQRSRWTYDEAGNRLSVTDPAGTTTTAPDRLNRIARQTTAAGSTELSYSRAGRLEQISHPNGARSETRYDTAGRIERITHYQGSSIVARFEYAYDDRGNRIQERRIDASGTQRTIYDYDKDDRLTGTTVTAADSSVTETSYTLDEVGNRAREVVRRNSATVSDIAYTYQAHQRLTETRDRISGVLTEYSYDARGHLISETRNGQTTTYRPNAQDRLATLTLPGAPPVEVEYSYDSEGKRVERRTPTELTRFGWDGQTLRRETNAANNVIEAHNWAAGRILSSRRLNDTRYAQHDALRSPIRWSQSTGAEQGQLRYDAWGETTDTNPDLPRIAYTGHYREREGASYYAQQRYYRPGLGRFNRVDPWSGDEANPITLNKYLYANGNPLYYVDPTGMYAEAGHYYTVLLAAKEAGYSTSDSLRIALYAQLPDEIPQFDAINQAVNAGLGGGETNYVLVASGTRQYGNSRNTGHSLKRVPSDFSMSQVQGAIHNLLGEDSEAATARSRSALVSASSIESVGIAAHALGDSFSHRQIGNEQKLYPPRQGHFVHGVESDQISARTELYGAYVKSLVMALGERNGGTVSSEQAEAFARSMVETTRNAKNSAAISYIYTGTSGVPDGDRAANLAMQEARILESMHNRAVHLVATEGRTGEILLRPERSNIRATESVSSESQQDFLSRFFRMAWPVGDDVANSVYAGDLEIQRLSKAVREHLEEVR